MNIIYESLLFILWCTYRIYEALLFILWCTSHHHLFILWCTSHHYQVWCTSHQKQFWSISLEGALLTHNSKLKISSMTTCAMIFFSQTSPASPCLSRQPYTTHASYTTRVALPPSFCNASAAQRPAPVMPTPSNNPRIGGKAVKPWYSLPPRLWYHVEKIT